MAAIKPGSEIIGTLCTFCRKPLEEGQHAADLFVYERWDPTELDYIALAHRDCVLEQDPVLQEGWDYDDEDHTGGTATDGELWWAVCSCAYRSSLSFADREGALGEGRYHRVRMRSRAWY